MARAGPSSSACKAQLRAAVARASSAAGLRSARSAFGGSQLARRQQPMLRAARSTPPVVAAESTVIKSESDEEWKVIAKAEIPALVPRGDFLDQLLKWCIIEFEENGRRRYGMKMVCDICDDYLNDAGEPTAFCIKMKGIEEGEYLEIFVCMDSEVVVVEKNLEGFGTERAADAEENPFAQVFEITGKNLIIRRKVGPLPEPLRETAAAVLQAVSKAVNTYYAFGSVYADDAT